MAILQATSSITGLAGVQPTIAIIDTNDTTATVTTSGYLTHIVSTGGLTVYGNTGGLIAPPTGTMALVNTTTGPAWFQVTVTGIPGQLVYSLSAPAYAGPATFSGNVSAGSSGVAGHFLSYPATSAKGSFNFTAVANTGNTVTTLSNDAMGQASTVNIPDPGNAIGQLLIGATATPLVSGNLIQASGTAGLVVDSGIAGTALNGASARITLTAAQFIAGYAAPILALAAPGANKMYANVRATFAMTYGSAQFTTGGAVGFQYGSTADLGGTKCTGTLAAATLNGLTASSVWTVIPAVLAPVATATAVNAAIYLSNDTAPFAVGTGATFVVEIFANIVNTN